MRNQPDHEEQNDEASTNRILDELANHSPPNADLMRSPLSRNAPATTIPLALGQPFFNHDPLAIGQSRLDSSNLERATIVVGSVDKHDALAI